MFRGRDALRSIDRSIQELRRELEQVSQRTAKDTDDLARYRQRQAETLRKLAGVRLSIAQREPMVDRLSRTERDALQLLSARNDRLKDLEARLDADGAARAGLDGQRHDQADRVEVLEHELADAEAKHEAKLADDADYKAQLDVVAQAERIAEEAARKTELAKDDREEKGAPYEADPLFVYLWERKFGTDAYRAGPLIRMLDRWVAGLIRYHDARLNYQRLIDLPTRLGEHAERVSQDADREAEALNALARERRVAAGVQAIEDRLTEAEAELARIDSALEEEAGAKSALEEERARYLRGEDDDYAKAVALLSETLARADLRKLHREALLTPERDDEALVEEIADLQEEIEETEEDLKERREMARTLERRRVELEDVRARFVRKRYDSRESYFDDDDFLENLLKGIARGAISGGGLWREIERHQRRTASTSSRSRSRSRTPNIGTWGSNRSNPWSGGGGRRTGGFGGGGFRTGGGFGGGGGFKTGGGF